MIFLHLIKAISFRGGTFMTSAQILPAPRTYTRIHHYSRVLVLFPQGDALGYRALQTYGLHAMATCKRRATLAH
jgi:hypothetical protein